MKTPNCLRALLGIFILHAICGCSERKSPDNEIQLWPEIEPFQTGYLKVSDIHEIYYELCGNPDGIPVFVIHGGPGAGCNPIMRRFFNPEKYLIVLHDQRGCGRSRPRNELKDNNTNALVGDIEQLRLHLNLDKIILFGGSWGSALSLAYSEEHSERITAMVLRGIYLATKEEDISYLPRLKYFFPELYQNCLRLMPDSVSELSESLFFSLYQSSTFDEWKIYLEALDRLESAALYLYYDDKHMEEYYDSEENMRELNTIYLIYLHYAVNSSFIEEGQLLENLTKIQDIPVTIVNGRYDITCPPYYAYLLHEKLPGSKLIITEKAGHTMTERTTEIELLKAMVKLENISE